MDKLLKQTSSPTQEKKYSLNYRFINVASLETGESINIGIIIEEREKSPRIKIIDNIEIVQELFPIFDINHINFSIKAIEIKYKMKKVKKTKVTISNTVSISDARLYKINYDNLAKIDELLFQKYISIQRTQTIFSLIYEKFRRSEKLNYSDIDNSIDVEVVTKPLSSNKLKKNLDNFKIIYKNRGREKWNH